MNIYLVQALRPYPPKLERLRHAACDRETSKPLSICNIMIMSMALILYFSFHPHPLQCDCAAPAMKRWTLFLNPISLGSDLFQQQNTVALAGHQHKSYLLLLSWNPWAEAPQMSLGHPAGQGGVCGLTSTIASDDGQVHGVIPEQPAPRDPLRTGHDPVSLAS